MTRTDDSESLRVFVAAHEERGVGELDDRFGRSTFQVASPVDLHWLEALAARPNIDADVLVGPQRERIRVGGDPPTESDRVVAQSLSDDVATTVSAIEAAPTGRALIDLIDDELEGAEVVYQLPGWIRTEGALEDALTRDWTDIADRMVGLGHVVVGAARFGIVKRKVGTRVVVPDVADSGGDESLSSTATRL